VVESQPSKLLVAGSIPVSRSIRLGPLDIRAGCGAMPRRSGEAAEEGNLRSPLRVELRLTGRLDLAGCGTRDLSAVAPKARRWKVDSGTVRRKAVWGA
jgi:hypothetical protein